MKSKTSTQVKNPAHNLNGLFGVTDVIKPKKKGSVVIDRIEFKGARTSLDNMRFIRDGHSFMIMYDGTYTRLIIDKQLMMSDTNMERQTNEQAIRDASGDVFIVGLGLGLVIRNMLELNKKVKSITVLENNKDVIDLVAPYYKHPKVTIIHGDVHTWEFPKETKFDYIYFDIWATISQDNLPMMTELHRKYRKHLNQGGTMRSWMREWLQKEKAKETRERNHRAWAW